MLSGVWITESYIFIDQKTSENETKIEGDDAFLVSVNKHNTVTAVIP
jgi:hypothetical protein